MPGFVSSEAGRAGWFGILGMSSIANESVTFALLGIWPLSLARQLDVRRSSRAAARFGSTSTCNV